MKIAVDARELIGRPTGVGRYLGELLACWSRQAEAAAHTFTLITPTTLTLPDGLIGTSGARIETQIAPAGAGRSSARPSRPRSASRADAGRVAATYAKADPTGPDPMGTDLMEADSTGSGPEMSAPDGLTAFGHLWWEQRTLPAAAAALRADVLFCPGYSGPLLTRLPVVVSIHDVSFWAHPEWFQRREGMRRRLTTWAAARRARLVLTLTGFSRDEILRWLGARPERVRAIAPGVGGFFDPERRGQPSSPAPSSPGPSSDEPSSAGPPSAGPLPAEPSSAEASSAEPSTAGPSSGGPSPSSVGSSSTESSSAGASSAGSWSAGSAAPPSMSSSTPASLAGTGPRLVSGRATLSSPSLAPIVLTVGSIFNRRHVDLLIRAIARVVPHVPDVQLVVVGENRTYPHQDLAALARSLGVADRVALRAYVSDDELRTLYGQARAFAFLSTYEGFGLTPLEAIVAGVPTVVAETEVARDVHAGLAYLVPPGDVDALAERLRAMLTEPPDAARQAALARAARERYPWTRTATATLAALQDATGPAPPTPRRAGPHR